MEIWYSFALIPYALSFTFSLTLAIYAGVRYQVHGALPFALLALAEALWTLGYITELISPTRAEKLFWDNVQWIAAFAVSIAFLNLALHLVGRRPGRLFWLVVWVFPMVFSALAFTNDAHQLLYPAATIQPASPFDVLYYPFTAGFWLGVGYSYALSLGGLGFMAAYLRRAPATEHIRLRIIGVGLGLPIVITLIGTIIEMELFGQRDLSPFAFILSNAIIAWGIFRYRIFNVMGLARALVIDHMHDVVVVVDSENRIIDLNPTARAYAAASGAALHYGGLHLTEVFPAWKMAVDTYPDHDQVHTEVSLRDPATGSTRYAELRIEPIYGRDGRLTARVLLARDITERKAAETDLQFLNHAAMSLLMLPDAESIYTYIGHELHRLLGDVFIIINENLPDKQTVRIQGVYGLGEGRMQQLLALIGKDLMDRRFPLHPDELDLFKRGRLNCYAGGIVELAKPYFPRLILEQVKRLFDLSDVYLIGLQTGDVLYAGVQIHTRHGGRIENTELIEAFIYAASSTLERVQAEAALREAELRYRALFEQSYDAVFILDMNGTHIAVNQRAADMLGYTRDEIIGLTYHDLIMSEEWPKTQIVMQQLQDGKRLVPYERVFRRKDGSPLICEVHPQLVHDSTGQPTHFQSIVRDISERKRMEAAAQSFLHDMQALQEVQLELVQIEELDLLCQRMIELSRQRLGFDRMALFLFDADQTILRGTFGIDMLGNMRDERYYFEMVQADHWIQQVIDAPNHAVLWQDAAIYDNAELIGAGWKIAATLWDGQRALGCLVSDNFNGGRAVRAYELELISILGTTFGHLITRQRSAEALRESETRYRSIISALSEGIILHGADGRILTANAAVKNLLGLTHSQLTGYAPVDLHWNMLREDGSPFPSEEHPVLITLRTGQPLRDVIMGIQKPDDELTWLAVNTQPLFREGEAQPHGVVSSFADITARKQAQAHELALALERERVRLITRFVQEASHEFRTPLTIISTGAYLMMRAGEIDKRQEQQHRIEEQIARITRLLESLLLMARLDSGIEMALTPADLCDVLRQIIPRVEAGLESADLRLTLQLNSASAPITADLEYLYAALMQLLDNAVRYSPDGGRIAVRIDQADDRVWCVISDQGHGIAPEDMERIFERFWRKDTAHSEPGFGLGMPMAQKIISLHGGEIIVESALGQGTTVRFWLPLRPA